GGGPPAGSRVGTRWSRAPRRQSMREHGGDGGQLDGALATTWKTCQCFGPSQELPSFSSSSNRSSVHPSKRTRASASENELMSSSGAQVSRSPNSWPANRPPGTSAPPILDHTSANRAGSQKNRLKLAHTRSTAGISTSSIGVAR